MTELDDIDRLIESAYVRKKQNWGLVLCVYAAWFVISLMVLWWVVK